jgi:hypothetical protein
MTEAAVVEPARIEAAIVALVQQRGAASSACPSDVARLLSPDHWRALMPQVREAASRLAQRGKIEIAQRGKAVSPTGPWKGPIRLRLPRG